MTESWIVKRNDEEWSLVEVRLIVNEDTGIVIDSNGKYKAGGVICKLNWTIVGSTSVSGLMSLTQAEQSASFHLMVNLN